MSEAIAITRDFECRAESNDTRDTKFRKFGNSVAHMFIETSPALLLVKEGNRVEGSTTVHITGTWMDEYRCSILARTALVMAVCGIHGLCQCCT
ncbi:hypothetical protein EVAR_99620_1 [Eumeta japonica]|uniref:Uncharacterized protein n=1 Tax=Eumeta variegata TaxID=151549 RepID=A0A4C2A5T0_EUMVA|nr:hypothetical protein EVAR_99620_1 [Eumeta japonica]